MTWTIRLAGKAAKTLKTLDKPTKKRIETFVDQLTEINNPRTTGISI